MRPQLLVRALTLDDLEPYVAHAAAHFAESGRDGDGYSGPYSRHDSYPVDAMRERTRERWRKSLDTPNWRRAWGGFDGGAIAGSASLTGGDLPTVLHRADLGISVLRGYRRQGIGRRLLREIITWCREQPSIAWIDLGVFGDNQAARKLFDSMGFGEVGRVADRWRIDGHHVDEISMTLAV